MKVSLYKAPDPAGLPIVGACTGIRGPVLDERGNTAVDLMLSRSARVYSVEYDSHTHDVTVDAVSTSGQVESVVPLNGSTPVLLEATTLGFVELFLCIRGMVECGARQVQIVYCEPGSYRQPGRSELLRRRHFELSGVVRGFAAVPGAAMMFDERRPQHVVFFLGYEEYRLGQALEQFPIDPALSTVVFGVPAFQAGWEMDSFANNVNVLRQLDRQPEVEFCGAENPLAAYRVIADVHKRCASQRRRLFVAPMGTKPHGVGAALFAAVTPGVGILYDHPERKKERTASTYNWHLFDIQF